MKNINSVLINNSLKAGHSEEIFKTLELLHKIGVIPSKKKKTTRKPKMYDEEGNEIKQTHDMGEGYAETKDDKKDEQKTSSRIRNGSAPLQIGYSVGPTDSIQNLNKAIEDKKAQIKALEDQSFNNPKVEEVLRSWKSGLAILADKVDYLKNKSDYSSGELSDLKGRFGPIESRFREPIIEEPDITGISKPYEPFQNVRGAGDAVEAETGGDYEDEDIDMTNQGSQDIPQEVMREDVVPQADEVFQDEEDEGFMPSLRETTTEPSTETPKPSAKAEAKESYSDEIGKFNAVEKFYNFSLPHGKQKNKEDYVLYVKKLADEAQIKVDLSGKSKDEVYDIMKNLVNKQYNLIQTGEAINYDQRLQAVANSINEPIPSNTLNSQKRFLPLLFHKLKRVYKPSNYTSKESVSSEVKKLVNEIYKTLE